jgi:hypothetical protein
VAIVLCSLISDSTEPERALHNEQNFLIALLKLGLLLSLRNSCQSWGSMRDPQLSLRRFGPQSFGFQARLQLCRARLHEIPASEGVGFNSLVQPRAAVVTESGFNLHSCRVSEVTSWKSAVWKHASSYRSELVARTESWADLR